MSEDKSPLCSIGEVIRSVVDENDLDAGQKRHFEQCPVCRQERRNLAGRLELLGRTAADYAPLPVQRVALPEKDHPLMLKRGSGWQLAFGTAAGFALVVLVAAWIVFYGGFITPMNQLDVAREMAEDEILMAEISMLEENPLPDAYREISPEVTSGDIDEDIFDFIVPVSSRDQWSRGKEA
jgi:hypothetical protein